MEVLQFLQLCCGAAIYNLFSKAKTPHIVNKKNETLSVIHNTYKKTKYFVHKY